MKNIYKYIYGLMFLAILTSCDEWLDINDNPNSASQSDASVEQVLPATQLSMAGTFSGGVSGTLQEHPSIFVQHYNNLTPGRFNIFGTDVDPNWRDIYSEGLRDIEFVVATGTESENWHHVGIAQVQKAYIYSVLVDLFGEVPFSGATEGQENLNPTFESGEDIYPQLFTLIDEGIANLQKTPNTPVANDLFYAGDAAKWIKAANTLKLKLYNQIRLVDEDLARNQITQLINTGNLMSSSADDWEFLFGSSNAPLNQHPLFVENYTSGGAQYMSAYMIFELNNSDDPRVPYYFFRQSLEDPTGDDVPCDDITAAAAVPYGAVPRNCYYGRGYYSRIQGDDSGIPNDTQIRTVFGVYPFGGAFDEVQIGSDGNPITARAVSLSSGTGAGIQPLVTYFMSLFIQAEAALMLGTPGNPRDLLEDAVRAQITKVVEFGASQGGWGMSSPWLDDLSGAPVGETVSDRMERYITDVVLADYDTAASDEERLQVIIREFHKATYGMGYEAFNAYRRTGYPLFWDMNNKDLTLVTYPDDAVNAAHSPIGAFPRRLLYSIRELNTNPSAPNQEVPKTTPVFWDNN